MPAGCSFSSARSRTPTGWTASWSVTHVVSCFPGRISSCPAARRRDGISTANRSTWRRAFPACSWPATHGQSRPNAWRPRSARARWRSCSCTDTWTGCEAGELRMADETRTGDSQANDERTGDSQPDEAGTGDSQPGEKRTGGSQAETARADAAACAIDPSEGEPCDINELRSLFLFDRLDEDQLRWLCDHGRTIHRPPGYVYREGEPDA